MQFSAAILAVAAASVASAEAVFKVTDFSAACTPHSVQCYYEFDVIQAGAGETTPIHCQAQAISDGSLPAITDGTCAESSRTFTVAKADGGLVLTLSQPVSPISNLTAEHTIPASQLKFQQTGASNQETYIGPAAFDLE